MRKGLCVFGLLAALLSCQREKSPDPAGREAGPGLSHEMIVLGEKLEDPYTVGNVRVEYLHKIQTVYEHEVESCQYMIDHGNSHEIAMATKRKEKLTKQIKECKDYDALVAHIALSRIDIDLDDGVKVNYRKVQTGADGKFCEILANSKDIMVKEQ